MKRFRVQVTLVEVAELWIEAEDWEEAEDIALAKHASGEGEPISGNVTAEVAEEEDIECDE